MLGLVRAPFGHTSVLSSWSMPPPVDRIRDLPSSSDLSFPQPVHESVSGTLATTTGQDLSLRPDGVTPVVTIRVVLLCVRQQRSIEVTRQSLRGDFGTTRV